VDYRFRRTTRVGGPDSSFATIDMANQRAVFSRPVMPVIASLKAFSY
jgi:hypothetical protein